MGGATEFGRPVFAVPSARLGIHPHLDNLRESGTAHEVERSKSGQNRPRADFPRTGAGHRRNSDGRRGQAGRQKGSTAARSMNPSSRRKNSPNLETTPDTPPFDGDPLRFRLAIEAMRPSRSHLNTTPISRFPSPGLTRCPTSWRQFMSIFSPFRASASSSPTIQEPGKRSW